MFVSGNVYKQICCVILMKKFGVLALVFVSLLLVSSFVSAQQQQILKSIADAARSFYDTIFEPFGKFLLGQNTDSGELFFAKLLFFLILVTLVNYALSQFPPLEKRAWMVSAIVAILAVRYITPAWIETIVLPYTALGIALTSFFPFILYFFFVEKGLERYVILRKVAWIFAAVVFVGLFLYRDTSRFPASLGFNPAIIYLITAGLCLIMFIADNTIQRAFARVRVANIADTHNAERQIKLDNQYVELTKNEDSSSFDVSAANKVIRTIRSKAKGWGIPVERYPLVS